MRTMGYDFDFDLSKLSFKEDNIFNYLSGYNCIYTDSGRSCIKLLSRLIPGAEILVPAFSCASIVYSFTEDVKPVFYNVNMDFSIDFEDLMKKLTLKTKAIYITNYFGHMINDEDADRLSKLRDEYGLIIIEDNTQSVFSGGIKVGDYAICSIRKWFAVPDGGIIYSKKSLDCIDTSGLIKNSKQNEKLYPQILKSMIVKNWIDYPISEVVELFARVENDLNVYADANEIFLMNDFTEFMFKCHNINTAIECRKKNEMHLRELIHSPYLKHAIIERDSGECPFNLPMYCDRRDELWNYLVKEHKIYASILWKTHLIDPIKNIGNTGKMGREIICFPVDQRYRKADMEYLAEAINSFTG